jgi:hypothetical protein
VDILVLYAFFFLCDNLYLIMRVGNMYDEGEGYG